MTSCEILVTSSHFLVGLNAVLWRDCVFISLEGKRKMKLRNFLREFPQGMGEGTNLYLPTFSPTKRACTARYGKELMRAEKSPPPPITFPLNGRPLVAVVCQLQNSDCRLLRRGEKHQAVS